MRTTGVIRPKQPALEISETDVIIQEQAHNFQQALKLQDDASLFASWNAIRNETAPWQYRGGKHIKLNKTLIIIPLAMGRGEWQDGEPTYNPGDMTYYSFPSMLEEDHECKRRIGIPKCHNPVVGIQPKLAFFNHTIYV